jgi:hypothetical protein
LNEFLHYTYPIGVFGNEHEVVEDLIEDELALGFVREGAEDLLDDVGPLEILSQFDYMTLEGLCNQVLLGWTID